MLFVGCRSAGTSCPKSWGWGEPGGPTALHNTFSGRTGENKVFILTKFKLYPSQEVRTSKIDIDIIANILLGIECWLGVKLIMLLP